MANPLVDQLKSALKNEEFDVYFQPIVSLKRSCVVGLEALIRWNHPDRGLLLPGEFIEVAEQSGLIVPMGQWVLTRSCATLQRWLMRGIVPDDLTVAVNVAPPQWQDGSLIASVTRTLDATGLPAHHLKLEITESSAMHSPERVTQVLEELRGLGVRSSIDDFGTGYASLDYLRSFPVATLKIDRSFVQGLGEQRRSSEIVSAVIKLAHSLGMDVIAEGVETHAQRRQLVQLNCECAQGYLFARPMESADFVSYISGFVEVTRPDQSSRSINEETAEHVLRDLRRDRAKHGKTPRLVVRKGPGAGTTAELSGSELIMGRSPDAGLSIPDNHLSRHHARVFLDDKGRLFLQDLGSRNGTYCNGQRVDRCPVRDGDRVRVGHSTIEIWLGDRRTKR